MKKRLLTFFVLGMTFYSNAAPRTITSPYTPGFLTRNAWLCGALTIGISNIALKFAVKKQTGPDGTPPISSIFVRGISYLTGYLAYKLAQPKDLDMILLDPAQALQSLLTKKNQHLKKNAQLAGLQVKETDLAFIKAYVELDQKYRSTFEKHVDDLFEPLLAIEGKTINYVGFGSTSCVKDFMMAIRALTKKPNAIINISLVGSSDWIGERACENILREKFKNQAITVKIYNSIQDYSQAKANKGLKPDLVVGVDITNELVNKKIKVEDYAPLLMASAENNVILSKAQSNNNNKKYKTKLFSISSINNFQTGSKIKLENLNIARLYTNNIPLPKTVSWWDRFVKLTVANRVDL